MTNIFTDGTPVGAWAGANTSRGEYPVTQQTGTNYWPWVLIAIPFAAVLFGFVMVGSTLMYPDDVVVDSYYKDGMAINQQIGMDETARDRQISARLVSASHDIGHDAGHDVTSRSTGPRFQITNVTDSAVVLNLFHVIDKTRDVSFVLLPDETAEEIYSLGEPVAALLSNGIWYIELLGADDNWRLRGRIETPLVELVLASSGTPE